MVSVLVCQHDHLLFQEFQSLLCQELKYMSLILLPQKYRHLRKGTCVCHLLVLLMQKVSIKVLQVFVSLPGTYTSLLRELVAEFTLTDNPANTTTSLLRSLCHIDDSVILGSWLQETDHKAVEDQVSISQKLAFMYQFSLCYIMQMLMPRVSTMLYHLSSAICYTVNKSFSILIVSNLCSSACLFFTTLSDKLIMQLSPESCIRV